MADVRGFKLALDQFAAEVEKRGVEFAREVALQAFTGVVLKSPVGNNTRWKANVERARKGLPPLPKGYVGGHFRKNWKLQINSAPTSTVDGVDNSGQKAIDGAMQALLAGPKQLADIRSIHIANNLPYAEALEDGRSKQAPLGMVAQTKAEIEARYRRVQ